MRSDDTMDHDTITIEPVADAPATRSVPQSSAADQMREAIKRLKAMYDGDPERGGYRPGNPADLFCTTNLKHR